MMSDPILKLKNVTMQFGGLKAVDDVTFDINKREILGLIGPNGAGKTTVFNVITGEYVPTYGNIYYKDVIINKKKPYELTHMGIARTFQNIRLFKEQTVLENVMVAKHHILVTKDGEKDRKEAGEKPYDSSYKWFWKNTFRIGYPKMEKKIRDDSLNLLYDLGLKEEINHQAGSLPYGKQRLLEIARAISTGAELLLLDEPAAGMNPTESKMLMKLVQNIRDKYNLTVFLIEHDMKVVMSVCERILVLDYGKLIAHGNSSEIQSNPKVIEAYLGKEWRKIVS
jgi:branched-chain amino acid transport system ATP-binding protein